MPRNQDRIHLDQAEKARLRDQAILQWLAEGKTQREIARHLGVSFQRVSALVKRARAREDI